MKKSFLLLLPLVLGVVSCGGNEASSSDLGPEGSNYLRPLEAFGEPLRNPVDGSSSRIETFSYESGGIARKAKVYLPEGYDASSQKYDVVYMLHGTNGNENQVFDVGGRGVLDHLIRDQKIKPVIMVTPTFYYEGSAKTDDQQIADFIPELISTLIPELESHYKTHLSGKDEASVKSIRDHRTFGGYSMGGITTWSLMWTHYDYFKNYLPLSGYCNKLTPSPNTEAKAKATAKKLVEMIGGRKDHRIYAVTGSTDFVEPYLTPLMKAFEDYPDSFSYGDRTGNTAYSIQEGADHNFAYCANYLYSALPWVLSATR